MKVEILTIGSELLLGQILDTNARHLARKLTEIGGELCYHTTVGDHKGRMREVFSRAMERVDVVITTGGIGPTEDDLTREVSAEILGKPLVFRPELMAQIEERFRSRGFTMNPNNRKQAYIPEGAIPIENPMGTAPGFIARDSRATIIALPGVPREMEYLVERVVLPYLVREFRLGRKVIRYKVLRVCGLTESGVDKQIGDLIKDEGNPTVGLLASPGDIRVRIAAGGSDSEEAERLIKGMAEKIRKRLGILVYGEDDETLEAVVSRLLAQKDSTLSIVESYTGGLVAERLTREGSERLLEAYVIPAIDAFERRPERPERSAEGGDSWLSVQLQWAQWTKMQSGADIGMAVGAKIVSKRKTEEGEIEKVGISIAISGPQGSKELSYTIGGPRVSNRNRASIVALDALRKVLLLNQI